MLFLTRVLTLALSLELRERASILKALSSKLRSTLLLYRAIILALGFHFSFVFTHNYKLQITHYELLINETIPGRLGTNRLSRRKHKL